MTDWLLAHGDDLQVALFFALFAVLAVVERWWPRRPGTLDRRSRWPANLFLTLVNLVALGALPISLIGAAVWAQTRHFGLLNRIALPAAVVVALTLVLRGFVSFGTHWLMHKVPLFWRVHRVHHLDTELDVTTTVRFHPLEFAIALAPGVPFVVLLGLSPWVLAAYELLDVAVTLWTHANLRLPAAIERVVRYAIVTPDLHRVHHSAWQPETDSNFGAVFPVWDLVFGTFRATPSVPVERMTLGLDEVRGRDAQRPLWLLASVRSRTLQGRTPPTP
jgi:sterol desaturase/sphingolipid hydroxylase (fatty acid hydroxylase superfamily)